MLKLQPTIVGQKKKNVNAFLVLRFWSYFYFDPYISISSHLGSVWLEEWKNGRMKNCERMEMWEDRKYLVFPLVCLVGMVEKWEGGKIFCLVVEKKGMMKNVIYIN